MRATIRRLHSPDIDDLVRYRPTEPDCFGFLLQILAGPENSPGEESFDVLVCSPRWIAETHSPDDIIEGRHLLILLEYDFDRLERFLHMRIAEASGESWEDVAEKLSRFGRWEFENYGSSSSHRT
jgi:hypothetical protein